MTIRLSICIPTYNRAAFIGEALDSVIRQATEEVEIIVSDNASTDDTEGVVRAYQTQFSRLTYYRSPENRGADQNYLKVVELAQGEFCWLLGSDDALSHDAIAILMPMLNAPDVYLTDRTNMTRSMDQMLEAQQKMLASSPRTNYRCSDPAQLRQYFHDALHIGSLFSYISAIVVRRDAWLAQPVIEDLIGSCWTHVAQIFQMMRAGSTVHYIGLPLVLNRTGNDSFHATVGYTRRRLIDLDYPRVARAIFSNNPYVLERVTSVVSRQFFTFRVILSDKRAAFEADGAAGVRNLRLAYCREFHRQKSYRLKMGALSLLSVFILTRLRIVWHQLRAPR
jgi:abequosyltransferase